MSTYSIAERNSEQYIITSDWFLTLAHFKFLIVHVFDTYSLLIVEMCSLAPEARFLNILGTSKARAKHELYFISSCLGCLKNAPLAFDQKCKPKTSVFSSLSVSHFQCLYRIRPHSYSSGNAQELCFLWVHFHVNRRSVFYQSLLNVTRRHIFPDRNS